LRWSLGLLLLQLLRPLLGHLGFLGLQQFSRNAAGTVLRIEQQFPQLSAEDGRLLLAQKRGKIHLRQLGIDGGRRRTVLWHRRQKQIDRHALDDLIFQSTQQGRDAILDPLREDVPVGAGGVHSTGEAGWKLGRADQLRSGSIIGDGAGALDGWHSGGAWAGLWGLCAYLLFFINT